jgi:hypothetical protein
VSWDAHRDNDGSWLITGGWQAGAKSGTTRWTFDLQSRTVAPADAATLDFAEGTRLVRVVPEVPAGLHAAPPPRGRPVSVVPDTPPEPPAADDDIDGFPTDALALDGLPLEDPRPDDAHVRDVHAPIGSPDDDRQLDELLDEVADHDTVVLGRSAEDSEDPRARIPAWEDIVFGVRRHR